MIIFFGKKSEQKTKGQSRERKNWPELSGILSAFFLTQLLSVHYVEGWWEKLCITKQQSKQTEYGVFCWYFTVCLRVLLQQHWLLPVHEMWWVCSRCPTACCLICNKLNQDNIPIALARGLKLRGWDSQGLHSHFFSPPQLKICQNPILI